MQTVQSAGKHEQAVPGAWNNVKWRENSRQPNHDRSGFEVDWLREQHLRSDCPDNVERVFKPITTFGKRGVKKT